MAPVAASAPVAAVATAEARGAPVAAAAATVAPFLVAATFVPGGSQGMVQRVKRLASLDLFEIGLSDGRPL